MIAVCNMRGWRPACNLASDGLCLLGEFVSWMPSPHSTALMDALLKVEGKNLNTMAVLLHNRAVSIDYKMKIYSV